MSIRIDKIADMTKPGVTAADIGTDHAFLPIELVRRRKAVKVYACDINEGPLKAAAKNIAEAGYEDVIIPLLSDGFENVPDDISCAILAGMGFYTAAGILERASVRLSKLSQIIVEVNRNTAQMRQWISERGYTIDNEVLIHDRGFDYIAISFTANSGSPLDELQITCGTPFLLRQRDDYNAFCMKHIKKNEQILSKLKKEDARREHLLHETDLWNTAMKR